MLDVMEVTGVTGVLDVLEVPAPEISAFEAVRESPPAIVLPTVETLAAFLDSLPAERLLKLDSSKDCVGAQVMRWLNPAAVQVWHMWVSGELDFSRPGRPYAVCASYAFDNKSVRRFFRALCWLNDHSQQIIPVKKAKSILMRVVSGRYPTSKLSPFYGDAE